MSAPEIFDRALRRLRRDRAAERYRTHAFLHDHIADELLARLGLVSRRFAEALVLGAHDGALARRLAETGARVTQLDAGGRFAAAAGAVQGDEDRAPFGDARFDLILSAGALDQINDLPGALILARRMLRPDGLFLAALIGAGSFPRLRASMIAADGERAVARIHPGIDVRGAGDLLMRAGFALPVADGERLALRYAGLDALVADLRGMAGTNLMRGAPPIGKTGLARARAAFVAAADDDGRTVETVEIVHLSGWAPAPGQPQPARRGSGAVSLAEALKRA